MNESLKLSELNSRIKESIFEQFQSPLWVIGEISGLSERSGACYFDLIEKSSSTDQIVAQMAVRIWSNVFRMLKPYFETSTGQRFGNGIKVLLKVKVIFHELYGLSLQVMDIDPTYTLGDLAIKRREIIRRLTDEGVISMNKEMDLPIVLQNIAVISSESAAGYEDFVTQLTNNQKGYHFNIQLFPAIVQGNQAEATIIDALNRIFQWENLFDVVVIIRGGGSQVDLSCFDNYNLAYHITQFPLPVITGIGHEKDESIVDLVAHTRLKTPTAVAEFLISSVSEFEDHLVDLQNNMIEEVESILKESKDRLEENSRNIAQYVRDLLTEEKQSLVQNSWRFKHNVMLYFKTIEHQLSEMVFSSSQLSTGSITRSKQKLQKSLDILQLLSSKFLKQAVYKLDMASQKGELMNPLNVLKRGYSITTFKGGLVKNLSVLHHGEELTTHVAEGLIKSNIKEIKQFKDNDNN